MQADGGLTRSLTGTNGASKIPTVTFNGCSYREFRVDTTEHADTGAQGGGGFPQGRIFACLIFFAAARDCFPGLVKPLLK